LIFEVNVLRKIGYHQLQQAIPEGDNPHENEIRHPDITDPIPDRDVRAEKRIRSQRQED